MDHNGLELCLGDSVLVFDDQTGGWSSSNHCAADNGAQFAKLQKANAALKEENRLLKLKIEILLDLVSVASFITVQISPYLKVAYFMYLILFLSRFPICPRQPQRVISEAFSYDRLPHLIEGLSSSRLLDF